MNAPPGNEEARLGVGTENGREVGMSGDNQLGLCVTQDWPTGKPENIGADANATLTCPCDCAREAPNGTFHPVIPANINSFNKLEAATFYHSLGLAPHPLQPPDSGSHKDRGKKPRNRGWRKHRAQNVTPKYLAKHFGADSIYNLGCVIAGEFVIVDLDSKSDGGASVRSWLAGQPELALVPHELTTNGAHFIFRCHDIPAEILARRKVLTARINDMVTAELYKDGDNVVMSPSIHPSGHQYRWEKTGQIPIWPWADLRRIFGFALPDAKLPGRPPKGKPWWLKYPEDLRTLNLIELMRETGHLGECLDADEAKWSVRCPWESEHSGERGEPGSDTVIFNKRGVLPAFHCLHAHCHERTLHELADWLEINHPGLIAKHCTAQRVWTPDQHAQDGRPRIALPSLGRADSDFCREVGACIGPRKVWFMKGQNVCSVAIRRINEKNSSLVFAPIQPVEAITAAEDFIETGVASRNSDGELEFETRSMSRECAGTLLASPQFKEQLPQIIRILDIRLPVFFGDKIVLPTPGYDARFHSYCPPDAPSPVRMNLDQALALFCEIHAEFCWKDGQSVIHAIARMITPFCRGLMGWDARLPFWHFSANRSRAGKDYLAACTQLLYEGRTCEDSPIGNDSEETRKRITAALMSGRRTMHFANCQGYIQDQALIGAITAKTFAARNLGSTDAKADLVLANEIEFSLSANVGLTFREDIEPRTRRIALEYFEENANGRIFKRADLHGWLLENRPLVLGAVAALVRYWVKCGCPAGVTPFNSYPEWARVVGGVMTCCGLGDPCLPHEPDGEIGGDRQERAMRAIYRIGYDNHPGEWIAKARLFELLDAASDDEALAFFTSHGDATSREVRTRIGKALRLFKNRHLDGIQLLMDDQGKGQRQELKFTQPSAPTTVDLDHIFGKVVKVGNVQGEQKGSEKNTNAQHLAECNNNTRTINGAEEPSQPSRPSTMGVHQVRPPGPWNGKVCSKRCDLDRVASDLASADRIALDIETYGDSKGGGLNPWQGTIRLLTLCRPGGAIHVIDLRAVGYDLGPLNPILEQATIIAHNAKFDLLWLRVKCGLNCPNVRCTITAARLLAAGTKPGNDLNQCLKRYLGIDPAADHSLSDWASMLLADDQLSYAARDVAHLNDLLGVMEDHIKDAGLDETWELETRLLPVVIDMEFHGIHVSRDKLDSVTTQALQDVAVAQSALRSSLGNPSLNPKSVPQLLAALQTAGLPLVSTSEEALKAANDGKFVPLVLAYRTACQRAQQAKSLVKHIEGDGRIHGRFEPLGTATGRFSSKEPNLQNIGRGELREAFTAPDGLSLIVADYSQIELRAAAVIAGETRMIEAYKSGADLHRITAATVLGKSEGDVTKSDRQLAKAVNFGLLYGQSAPGLVRYAAASYGVTMEENQARQIREMFFGTYTQLRQWHNRSHQQAKEGITEVRTRTGRRRLIPDDANDWERFTALVNTPVQGGTADGMKRALILIAHRLPDTAGIVSTVHDEVLVECPHEMAEQCREIVITAMVEAMSAIFPEVPIEVEAHICGTWAEK